MIQCRTTRTRSDDAAFQYKSQVSESSVQLEFMACLFAIFEKVPPILVGFSQCADKCGRQLSFSHDAGCRAKVAATLASTDVALSAVAMMVQMRMVLGTRMSVRCISSDQNGMSAVCIGLYVHTLCCAYSCHAAPRMMREKTRNTFPILVVHSGMTGITSATAMRQGVSCISPILLPLRPPHACCCIPGQHSL